MTTPKHKLNVRIGALIVQRDAEHAKYIGQKKRADKLDAALAHLRCKVHNVWYRRLWWWVRRRK